MSLETSFLNLIRGNRLSTYLGLKMDEGAELVYAPDYSYLEIPASKLGAFNNKSELSDKVSRNQYVQIVPACSLEIKGSYHCQIEPNPRLAQFGTIQPGYYIHPGAERQIPTIWFGPRVDVEAIQLDYAIRIYLRA